MTQQQSRLGIAGQDMGRSCQTLNWIGRLSKAFYLCGPCIILCPGGEIGRHVRLRGVCRKVCWFESSPGHSLKSKWVIKKAEVVKLVDTHVSGACAARYAGSSPAFGTAKKGNQPG